MKSRITGYLLLFVVSVAIFLVVLFPGHQLAAYFSQTLTHPQKNIYTNMENVHLSLPFSLKSEDARISIGRDFTVQPDFIKIRLGPGLVFGDQRQIHFNSELYKGLMKGSFGFEDTQPVAYTNVQLNLSGLEFDKIRYNTRMAQITMTGKIDGDYRYDADTDTQNDPGQGSILIKDFSADLTNSLFNRLKLSRIDFSRVDIRFTQEQNTINLSELTASGSVINVKLSGIIQLEEPVVNSRLTLAGTVLPDSPYLASFANSPAIKALVKNIKKDGIRFAVKGTLRQPEIKI
ncbi:MAG: type II secretion system protein GspN [Proteobacteria bacterium]|nr:type II secretion system protein GspN [Pseudomonadota bacterium]MBU1388661.1 type II secretion system protein GspN [Pseudomonadota bacterium]MBU1544870.1 type II secretion system protein GspN [Pseudomonadota bacterium]MBU2431477.1 type II secretion system protein GspN [Pseudomonadota bacterium]MBU2482038.1 type II secretion system protein GspN [Pseudomonadota bacterium]